LQLVTKVENKKEEDDHENKEEHKNVTLDSME